MAEFPLLKMINIGGRQTPFAFPQHSVNAEQGRVAYPVSVISQEQGIYSYEFIIKYKDGTQETVPNNSYEKIRVFENLKE